MKAVAVRALRGRAELLDLPVPSPSAGELAVRVEAAGMNPFDWKIADGAMSERWRTVFPLVLGVDGCGVVTEAGEGAARFGRGARLAGSFLHEPVGVGTYAEFTVVPATNVITTVPDGMSPTVAAALPTAGMTALQSIDRLALPAGSTVAIVGAAGGVGSFAVQLARLAGLRVVAVAKASTHERLARLGAETQLDVDAGPSGVGRPLDGLLDLANPPERFARWVEAIRTGGAAVSTIGSARPDPRVRTVSISMEPALADLQRLLAEAAAGRLVASVERTLPLEQGPAAFETSRAGHGSGKTVLLP